MTNDHNKILMLGLPEAGKTSFLAALVQYTAAEIDDKTLTQYKLSSNTAYINLIHETWLKGLRQERTKIIATQNSSTVAELYLQEEATGERFILNIPDFFGETFESQFNDRLIGVNYLEQIKESSGILLFINPQKIRQPVLIDDISSALFVAASMDSAVSESGDSDTKDQGQIAMDNAVVAIRPFDIEEVPTQIILVDLLETHLSFLQKMPLHVGIVISAWDTVIEQDSNLSPLKWLEISLPLLYQYLISNFDVINFKSFGISAQGGDMGKPEVARKLLSYENPVQRIIVHEDDKTHKNIASPVEWILSQWQKRQK